MPKKVFISYSHDSDTHKTWVRGLATNLIKNGIEVILDQWDLRVGEDIPKFVEDSILHSDRVLLICTENYVGKANKRSGGVGLEALVINSSLMHDLGTTKFVALVRQEVEPIILPELLKSRLYVDFSSNYSFERQLEILLKEIYEVRSSDKPELGRNPFEGGVINSEANEADLDENATKLDLARAYIDMGDNEGAVDILSEIMTDGNLVQQKEARQILQRISST